MPGGGDPRAIVAAVSLRPAAPVIRALTLDLDDTLWAVGPAILRAEQAQDAYLRRHCPRTAERYPLERLRALREAVATAHPELAHDFTTQRRLTLEHAIRDSGEDVAHVDGAFEAFYAERNTVELYADVHEGLPRLAARYPLAALTNGNADLVRIGLAGHFRFSLGAREHGAAKPAASIFHAACARLDLAPAQVLHVGDDPWLDIAGAAEAGLATCWINRHGAPWPEGLAPPRWQARDLDELLHHLS
jgi:FMN hydrolase / 5-amino-6-(5-phospho-D-ribitylamino)uracil phosphatase